MFPLYRLVRHGRSGQLQFGADIISRPGGRWTGLQCKRKAVWPVKTLTKGEIDNEVKEALTFKPRLEDFWILTTAPDDSLRAELISNVSRRAEFKKLTSVDWEADNKARAGRWLNPHVTTVVEDSLTREGQPKPQAVLLACCNERLE